MTADGRPRPRRLALAGLHGVWMVALSFLFLQWGWARADEARLLRLTELVRPFAPGADVAPADGAPAILAVNVAHELELVPLADSLGAPVGERAVVDRASLAALLRRLHHLGHPQAAVVLDVAFVDPSPSDPLLADALARTPNALAVAELGPDGRRLPTTVPVPAAPSVFPLQDLVTLKYRRVWDDSLATLPDRIVALLHPALHERRARWDWRHPLRLNTHLLTYRRCPPSVGRCVPATGADSDLAAGHLHLATLEAFPDDVLAEFVRGRLLLLGDYVDRDIHTTAVGDMPGPVLVANAYLGLVAGDDLVPLWLLLVLWAAVAAVSYALFHRRPSGAPPPAAARARPPGTPRSARRKARLWWTIAWVPLALLALSLVSSLYAGVHLQVLALTVYLGLVATLRPWALRLAALARRRRRRATARPPMTAV